MIPPAAAGAADTLTINGSYTQTSGGSLDIAVGGTTAGSGYSQLAVNGSATINGSLVLSLTNGVAPVLGQTFTIVNSASLAGQFATVKQSAVTGSVAFEPTYPGTSVVLVAEKSSTTTIASSVNPSIYGEAVSFTAVVKPIAPNTGTLTGTVTFFEGSAVFGSASLGSGGKATFKTSALSVGTEPITAVYSGDTTFATSTSAVLNQTVSQAGTTSKVTSSANPSVYGQTVTFKATVAVAAPATGTPSGTVTFYDGGSAIGSGTLSGGTASLSINLTVLGSHSITVFIRRCSPALQAVLVWRSSRNWSTRLPPHRR